MRKIDGQRREAFLAALTATANYRLAAERAKVSRRWASQLKRDDTGFRAACEAAVTAGKLALAAADRLEPPEGIRWADGEELVLTWGIGGGPVQAARARLHQWTPRLEQRFLASLARTANVSAACRAVGMSTNSAYRRRGQWNGFREAWDAALDQGVSVVEAGLLQRANASMTGDWDDEATAPPEPMTTDEMLQLLRQHHKRSGGNATREHRNWRRPRGLEEVRASILKKLTAIERMQARGALDELPAYRSDTFPEPALTVRPIVPGVRIP